MNIDPDHLINGHLDSSLSTDEQRALNDWIKADPENARRFALAVMLDDRIHLQYHSMKVTLEHFGNSRPATSSRPQSSHRIAITAVVACLLMIAFFYSRASFQPSPSDDAISAFHELVVNGRKPADHTYRITFVSDDVESSAKGAVKPNLNAGKTINEKMLYVRDGRFFVCTWKTADGGTFVTGNNDQESWSMPPGGELIRSADRMEFIGGLPSSDHLAPILCLYDHQEKVLSSFYNLELRKKSKLLNSVVAGKKPDTQRGPRRIEIDFDPSTENLIEMRIWPETPDHRRMSYTRIELVSSESLDQNWFTPDFHLHPAKDATPTSAD